MFLKQPLHFRNECLVSLFSVICCFSSQPFFYHFCKFFSNNDITSDVILLKQAVQITNE